MRRLIPATFLVAALLPVGGCATSYSIIQTPQGASSQPTTATASVVVPNLRRMGRGRAAAELEAVGLKLGDVTQTPSSGGLEMPPGAVAAQTPDSGTKAPKGSTVSVKVLKGSLPAGISDAFETENLDSLMTQVRDQNAKAPGSIHFEAAYRSDRNLILIVRNLGTGAFSAVLFQGGTGTWRYVDQWTRPRREYTKAGFVSWVKQKYPGVPQSLVDVVFAASQPTNQPTITPVVPTPKP